MKKLDKSKAYYLGDLNSEQRASFYAVLLSEDESLSIIRESEFKIEASDYVFCDDYEWYWYDEKDFKRFINLEVVNALTLIEEEEWKPKQGDKVLYTDDLVNWEEAIFLVKHNESYIVESDEMLLYAIEIKPYEEEIKIGDWVKNTDEKELILVTKDMNLECLNNESEYIKIANPELIKLLNNEL